MANVMIDDSRHLILDIEGWRCAACADRTRRALAAIDGVRDASVNLALERADICAAPGVTADRLVAAVTAAGFRAHERAEEKPPRPTTDRGLGATLQAVLGAVLALPFAAHMAAHAAGFSWHLPGWLAAGLATIALFGPGRTFFVGAVAATRHGSGSMDQLVALGTGAAYLWSLGALFAGIDPARLHFEAAVMIIAFLSIGKLLEARARTATGSALSALMALAPERATVATAEGGWAEVPVNEVRLGDRLLLRPGERLPVDAAVVEGETSLDLSLLTGESRPVTIGPGDRAPAGALNGDGRIEAEAVAVGTDTTLARIERLITAAQRGKAPIQRLVDRVVGLFVPAVLAIAAATFVGWMALGGEPATALAATIAVLVIACPCALGLATPTALVAGTGAAARAGILIRDLEALEAARGIDTLVFDKTGTLTEGRPTLTDLNVISDTHGREHILTLAAAVETGSSHPLARALVQAAGRDVLPSASDFRHRAGHGVAATVEGRAVAVGNRAWIDEEGIDTAPASAALSDADLHGATAVLIAIDGAVAAVARLEDRPRDGALEAVREAHARGLAVHLLTGDAHGPARSVAAALGIDVVEAAATPGGKLDAIETLKGEGRRVAVIGDGVNDAAALAAADLGMAIGSGTDVAIAAAPVTLMRPDPRLALLALDVAAATRRTLWRNLAWAFAYNLAALPAAALGLLTPTIAGGAMALSSLSVVGNAALLARWRAALPASTSGRQS